MIQKLLAAIAWLRDCFSSTIEVTHRQLVVLHLRDDVLLIYTKEPASKAGRFCVKETLQLLRRVFRYAASTEFYPLRSFQYDQINWHPVYNDCYSICISRPYLEEHADHGCDVRSIVEHELEAFVLERLPTDIQNFVESLRPQQKIA